MADSAVGPQVEALRGLLPPYSVGEFDGDVPYPYNVNFEIRDDPRSINDDIRTFNFTNADRAVSMLSTPQSTVTGMISRGEGAASLLLRRAVIDQSLYMHLPDDHAFMQYELAGSSRLLREPSFGDVTLLSGTGDLERAIEEIEATPVSAGYAGGTAIVSPHSESVDPEMYRGAESIAFRMTQLLREITG